METIQYKCPNCDAGLMFDPASQKFHCEYCDSYFEEEVLKQMNTAAVSASESAEATPHEYDEFEDNSCLCTCPSCGASVICDKTTAATTCYYCHNPVVIAGQLKGEFRPNMIIPFSVTRDQALQKFKDWISDKKYLPNGFFKKNQIENLVGVYFPYWLIDSESSGTIEGIGRHVDRWTSGSTEYTRTLEYLISRSGDAAFTDMIRNSLNSHDHRLAEAVLPFDSSGLIPFDMAYLSGFQAEKRDIPKEDLIDDIRAETEKYTLEFLKASTSKYDNTSIRSKRIEKFTSYWKYVLFPVWVLTYKDKNDKTYTFSVNGQTGNTCGELPVSKSKLWLLFAKVALPVFAIILLVGWLFS